MFDIIDFCCLATVCLLFHDCLKDETDVMKFILENRSPEVSEKDYLSNMLDLAIFWRRFHIKKGVERYKLEQASKRPVCNIIHVLIFLLVSCDIYSFTVFILWGICTICKEDCVSLHEENIDRNHHTVNVNSHTYLYAYIDIIKHLKIDMIVKTSNQR